jgi:hypothetical protein
MDPKEMACEDEHCLEEFDQNGFNDGASLEHGSGFSDYVKFSVNTLQHAAGAS